MHACMHVMPSSCFDGKRTTGTWFTYIYIYICMFIYVYLDVYLYLYLSIYIYVYRENRSWARWLAADKSLFKLHRPPGHFWPFVEVHACMHACM